MKKITQNLTNVKAWQSTIFAFMFLFSLTINAQEVGQQYLANPGINTATGANSTTPETGFDGNGNFVNGTTTGQTVGNVGGSSETGWGGLTGGAYASGGTAVNPTPHSLDKMFKLFKVGGADGQFVNQTITALPAGNYNWSFYTAWGDAGHSSGPTGTTPGNLPTWSAEGDNQPKFTILVQDADGAWVADQATVTSEPATVLTWIQDSGTWTNTETRDVRIKIAKNGGTAADGGSNTDKLMFIDDVSLAYASALVTSDCELTVDMVDTYGDGWGSGNELEISVNGVAIEGSPFTVDTTTNSVTLETNYGDSVSFNVVGGGSWSGEMEVTIGDTVLGAGDTYTFECIDPDAVYFAASVTTDGANATFSVTVNNFTVGAAPGEGDGHIHWSIFDSSDLETAVASGMIYSTDDVTLPLPNGNHTMVFSLVDPNHNAFDPPIESTLVFSTYASTGDDCVYTLTLNDQYNDGWDNSDGSFNNIDVLVNGVLSANYTTETGGESFSIPVSFGDVVTLSYNSAGSANWAGENSFVLADSEGNVLVDGDSTTNGEPVSCAAPAALSLQGIMDIDVSGGVGKGVHLVATSDIADLSVYGLGSANNQQGTDGQEFALSGSVTVGQHILVTNSSADATGADVFLDGYLAGHTFDLIINGAGSALQGNGNDAYELYFNDAVVETFGVTGNVGDPSQTSDYSMDWAYNDSWAYKVDDVWTYGGPNCTDGSNTTCASDCPYPFVICSSDPVFHDITFTVDARNILVRDRGMYVGGGIFGSADAHAMSDEDGDGVWSVVISLEEGATYTSGNPAGNWGFFNSPMDGGDWGTKENLEGLECADTENFNDRILPAINADTAIAYCFASCDTGCDALATRHDVTFNVDTNNIVAGVGTEGMWLGGGIMGSGKAHQLFDEDGDGVYTRVLSMLEGTTGNWVFLNSPPNHYDYNGKEDLSGQDCAVGAFDDRLLDPVTGAAEYTFCFASCDVSCSSGPVAIVAPWTDDFEDADISDWTLVTATDATQGTQGWFLADLSTAIDGGTIGMAHSWDIGTINNYLVSPLLDLTSLTAPLLSYDEGSLYSAFYTYHGVLTSVDFDGTNAATATWIEIAEGATDDEVSITREYAIPTDVTGIAFNYQGNDSDLWALDNVSVTETPGEPNAVDSNPDQAWTGYMNVFDIDADGVQGGFVFGQPWGVADLQTTLNIDAPNIILEPNFNGYADNIGDAFWDNGEGEGNKFMEASTYVESGDAFNGADLTFTGSVYENTLGDAHTASYFIKSLDPSAGYSDSLGGAYVFEMPASGEFSVTVDAALLPAGQIVQYGFVVTGRNANPENTGYGRVVIGEAGLSVSNNTPLDMVIYPNPSNGSYVTIQTPVNGVKYVEVFDITGKRLINTSLSADTLDVSSISSGLYLVKVTVEGQSKTSKLIIR